MYMQNAENATQKNFFLFPFHKTELVSFLTKFDMKYLATNAASCINYVCSCFLNPLLLKCNIALNLSLI